MSPNDTTPLSTAAQVAVDYDPFAGAALARVVPATAPQREVWLGATLEPDASLAYNESISLRLHGELDVPALQAALQQLVNRHEALRATFSQDGEELYIADQQELPCPVRDLSWLGVDEREADIESTLQHAVTTPFDLESGPLVRAELLRLDPQDHLLVFTAHHIVCDGWSFGVIVRDLAALYAGQLGADAELPPVDAFGDYALAEANHRQSQSGRDAEAYWLQRFTSPTPSLDLPTDHPRPRQRSFTSQREDLALDASLVADIKRMGAQRGASLYATLLSAFGLLLQRLSGQDDVVIGIPSAGQAAGGQQSLVGHCVNVLPLRVAIDPAAPFAESLKQVRGDLLDAFDHQQYTLGSLLARLALPRDPARLPLAGVLFNLDQALDERTLSFPGLSFEFAGNPRAFENFELFVNAVQVPDGLRLECQYNSDLFERATIRAWLDAYATLLRHAADMPDAAGSALGLVSEVAKVELLALQPQRTPYAEGQLAHEYFEAQVDRAPSRIAITGGAQTLTYAQLEERANRIAHVLRARGVAQGSLVGLSLARSPDMVAALLAVLKTGAGYVPLDPSFPAERLAFMAQDAALAALLVDDAAPDALALSGLPVLSLSRDADALAAASTARLPRDAHAATPESVAYLIYTSGSTGKPKGVRVPHRATSNFIRSMQQAPGITEDDRLVAVTTLSFDIAFLELMLPLSVGAAIVLASYDDVRDGGALRRLVEQSEASMMQATPAGWRILLESGWPGRAGFKAIAGGEPLPLDLAESLLERCGELWNAYGPTETTVWSTLWKVHAPRAGITIGQPIANTTVYILDEHGALCPLGMPGEIYIGGDGVTLGYLNRPELNAERFLPDPYSHEPQARMYRTGDRGRWLANGELEHRGRLDFQVKIRGYRIELGEIETALADLPEVARAVVVAREDRPGDVRLVAYLVPSEGAAIEETDLCPRLRQRLPDYMLPQHFMALEAIPLLPNGKIDRKSLPAPPVHTVAADRERLAPQSDTERRVAAAMEAVLALPELDVRDNFFALGGHSLLAAQLTARLNREFDITLSFRTLFDAPTIQSLAATIDQLKASGSASGAPPILRRTEQGRAPLSLMQRRLWSLEELQPGRVTYNAPSAHRLRGRLHEEAFQQALQELVQRQPILRTAFRHDGDDVAQVVEDIELALFPAEDLSALPEAEREPELMRRLQALTDTPFDLTRSPLFSARMFRLADDEHVFFFMPHHIIWDGWSFDILYAELSQLYKAFAEGKPSPLAPLPVTYGDFAAWHAQWLESEAFQAQLGYWRERLAKAQETRALPTDFPRRPGMSGVGRTEWIRVSREATDVMHHVAKQADATLNMALLALYYVLLSGLAGQRHLVVGTPVRARNQTEVESVMGYFNNLLPLHITVDPSLRFIDFVRQVKDAAIESFGHPDVPLEYLQRELRTGHGNGAVLYQALFSFQDARQRVVDWGGLSHEQILLFQSGATEDLGLWFLENTKGLLGGVTYNADILQADTARLQRDRYLTLMARVSADPTQTIDALNAIRADELAQQQQWHASDAGTEAVDLVAQFEAQVDRAPQAPALAVGNWNTSYAELETRSNRMAACLRQRGVGRGAAVGLCAEPGIGRLAAMLGTLKAGGTVVLLDPEDPPARLNELIADAGVSLLIGNATLEADLGWPHAKALWLDTDTTEIVGASSQRDGSQHPTLDDVAFVSYVPGANGQPGGHAVTHGALARLVQGLRDTLSITTADGVLGMAPASTGVGVVERLLPLGSGAKFVLAGIHQVDDGESLLSLVQASHASVIFAPSAAWRALLAAGWEGHRDLRAICVGGAPSPELAIELAARSASLWSLFGADDSALVATIGRVERPADGVHSGRALAGNQVWILDAQQRPCPMGAIGEIHLGGAGLNRAFGQRASAWASTSVNISGAPPLWPTGFRGRWLAEGQLQELGRFDRRVRVDGHDVDPVAVEALLLQQPNVAAAIAISRTDSLGDSQVDAYVAPGAGATLDRDALRAALGRVLAAKGMPKHLVVLDALPTLADGTVDIAALPLPGGRDDDLGELAVQPKTPGEQLLAAIWRDLLHLSQVRTSDNFFDIGGHSLLAVEMATRVQRETGVRLNLLDIANGSLGTLAAELATSPPATDERPPALGQRLRKLFGRR
ncbi:amino acid adenylation domain-containing protein [Dyella solisilvae]|uniref:Amino acid adenylation domain-containing protein n=1 Tax=Dyella solisilvae TaxID=1920168 RepID=A0A370K303_9GAMM|nr:non-ribosomal peptide synthetase [Dyella solisilvae]RDI97055.1 amino acid adenylation domain-containing protein [Dyella solisilvae]